ncbi:MAG: hypothetical protein ABI647_20665, partial [Gemmatimonadota bacterium]
LKAPSLAFDLDIKGGKVVTAAMEMRGAAGLAVHFDAGTAAGISGNINKVFFVPVDMSFPIAGLPVPLAITLRQTMTLTTEFTAQTATVSATEEYDFAGAIRMGLHNGQWSASAPTPLVPKQKFEDAVGGASAGVNGLIFGYGGKVIVGIGAFGFVTGPYVGYNTVIGISRSSDLVGPIMPVCRSSILDVDVRYGIGYSIPKVVAKAINVVLRLFNRRPIQPTGGVDYSHPVENRHDEFPAGCTGPPAQ